MALHEYMKFCLPRMLLITWIVVALAPLAACDRDTDPTGPNYLEEAPKSTGPRTYYFAVHPLYNPTKLQQAYQPLIDYLNARIQDAHLELEGSVDYQAYEQKIRGATPEFLLPNPWHTLLARQHGYHVIAEAGDSADFRGIFIVRKDSPITSFADLKGKTVSYPSWTALAACIMPQRYLYEHSVDVLGDITNTYVGSQESSIMNAYLKTSDIAATWPPPWRLFQKDHPAKAAEMRVIWQTEPLINNSVMVRQDIPESLAHRIRSLLIQLDQTAEGRAVLAASSTARFAPATDRSYDKVQSYITAFEKDIRPVETKR